MNPSKALATLSWRIPVAVATSYLVLRAQSFLAVYFEAPVATDLALQSVNSDAQAAQAFHVARGTFAACAFVLVASIWAALLLPPALRLVAATKPAIEPRNPVI